LKQHYEDKIRLCAFDAALTKLSNNRCPSRGEEVNSGWNWQATNQGWSEISTISTKEPSIERPEIFNPAFSILSIKLLSREIYGKEVITERHRHRYEVNNNLIDKIENAGLKISGRSIDGSLVEMVEISDHARIQSLQPAYQDKYLNKAPGFLVHI
jgi:hypothetical protein